MHTQVWVRELAAALMDMGNKPNAPAQASVEELVLAGVSHACLILAKPIAVQPNTVLLGHEDARCATVGEVVTSER